jgi:multicomponent Na+:H+ antiporter subunit G
MHVALDIISGILIAAGSFFVLVGALSLVRMPDIYARIHGASIIDTVGAGFLILGLIVQTGWSLTTVKLLFILAIFFFTLPVAAHALAQAALHEGVKPKLAEDRRTSGNGGPTDTDESGRPEADTRPW